MANYNLKYQCTFDPLLDASDGYTLQILQKGYNGAVINITGGSTPVLQGWQTDDPKAPIKGSSLSISLINDGSLPLNSFLSIDADEFKVIFQYGSQILFEGFLVQDDCMEELVDYAHEINLSANDNLGLLKDLTLDKADTAFAYTYVGVTPFSSSAPHSLVISNTAGNQIQPGDKIKIVGSAADGTYTASTVTDAGANFNITVAEEIPTQAGTAEPVYIGKINLLDKKPLISILGMCLRLTDLQLNTNVWGQINETSQDQTKCFLEQTLIDPGTFLKDANSYMDCYTVLTYIMSAFNFTLFQSMGAWQIVRWDELRYNNNNVPGYTYNSDMTLIGYALMQAPFDAGYNKGTYGENGLLQRAVRPFSYAKETFNFKQPPQLLRNFDLKTLGTLLREYNVDVWLWGGNVYFNYDSAVDSAPSGAIIIKSFYKYSEYAAPWWYDSTLAPQVADYFIRVVTDNIDNEIDRYMCAKNDNIKSYKIEANAGDIFTFSFSYRTQDSQSTGSNYITNTFIIELNDGTNRRFFKTTGWSTGSGYSFAVGPNDNTDNWHTVTIDITHYPIPFDGLLYVYLSGIADVTGTQNYTYTKDIRLDYIPLINSTTKITGQVHTDDQPGNPKNNNDVEIFMDSSPRNSVVGTLFLNAMDGLLQKRTSKWRHPYLPLQQQQNLGQLVTFEELYWRRIPRTIVEGSMRGLLTLNTVPFGCNAYVTIDPTTNIETATFSWTSVPAGTTGTIISYWNGKWNDTNGNATSPHTITMTGGIYPFRIIFLGTEYSYYFNGLPTHLSMLSILRYSQFLGFNFVAGKLSIDFKNNKFTGTWWEVWVDGEKDSDLTPSYTFNYLYSPV